MILSIVVTAHDENLILYKTLTSINNSLKKLSRNEYEIILHIDNGSQFLLNNSRNLTKYFPSTFVIYKNHFADVGLSRNFCANQAKGKYIFFIDADDLISNNFIDEALKKLESTNDDILLHPESCLSFQDKGGFYSLWRMNAGATIEDDIYVMFERNLWISSVIGKREIFIEHPYKATANGFGHEDYMFNMETLAANIRHDIVPQTMYFYRQKNNSLLRLSENSHVIQPKTNLFDFRKWKNFNGESTPATISKQIKIRQKTRSFYIRLRNHKITNAVIEPFATIAKNLSGKKLIQPPKIFPYELEQWKKVSTIETQLYPTTQKLKNIHFYNPRIGLWISPIYRELCNEGLHEVDYIFIVPWISTGGADKVVINYTKCIKKLWPDKKIAIITTLKSDNVWKDKLADNTLFIDYGNRIDGISEYDKDVLFTRLLLQLGSKKIHIINSEYAYRWTERHRALVASNFELYLSLFCYDIIPNTKGKGRFDYADPYAVSIYDLIKKIYTDNNSIVHELAAQNGFDKNKIIVQHQPCELIAKNTLRKKEDDCLRVLWASRICTQKNPDVLLEIADLLGADEDILIDVYGKFEDNYSAKIFDGHKNIRFISEFNGLESIKLSKYDCFLYTSFIDGLPNILIEATAYGLPIITSEVGGIGDLIINHKTGLTVNSPSDAKQFVKMLRFAKDNRKIMQSYQENAQKLLEEKFNLESYSDTIKKTFEIE